MTTSLRDSCRLFSFQDRFIILSNNEVLSLDKKDLALSSISRGDSTKFNDSCATTIYGIIGTISLLRGEYLLVITGRECVGTIRGHDVFRITSYKIIPFAEDVVLSAQQLSDEKKYIQMLEHILSLPYFYFSYSFDLTNSWQRQSEATHLLQQPLWVRADKRFFWNYYLVSRLLKIPNVDSWILPIMMGFIEIKSISVKERKIDFILISRRNKYRAGTRFHIRGLDLEGNVANNIETEQIVICDDAICSYLQTRGSVPLFWTQHVNMSYTPKPKLSQTADSALGLKKHFDIQESLYGSNTVVCLLNRHGSEGMLAQLFEETLNKIYGDKGTHTFIGFDFHKEVRGMNMKKLQNLLQQLQSHIEKQGYLFLKGGERLSKQYGVIRTNCMDNLDRTNVAQSVFARFVLTTQLRQLGILTATEEISDYPQLDQTFKNVWADNADVLSIQYAGTGAQKTDITRIGKRTLSGLLKDGFNAVFRYYLNNFGDGFKQDAFALFLGNYRVDVNAPSPFPAATENDVTQILVFVVSFAVCLFLSSVVSPLGKPPMYQLFVVLFWLLLLAIVVTTIKKHGHKFVDRPRLIPLEEL
jgi:hypothetical protein